MLLIKTNYEANFTAFAVVAFGSQHICLVYSSHFIVRLSRCAWLGTSDRWRSSSLWRIFDCARISCWVLFCSLGDSDRNCGLDFSFIGSHSGAGVRDSSVYLCDGDSASACSRRLVCGWTWTKWFRVQRTSDCLLVADGVAVRSVKQ